jgi:hypothetical protein
VFSGAVLATGTALGHVTVGQCCFEADSSERDCNITSDFIAQQTCLVHGYKAFWKSYSGPVPDEYDVEKIKHATFFFSRFSRD